MRRLFIRVVCDDATDRLQGYALCTTEGPLLTDEQILEHFPPETPGVDIRACGREFHGADEVEWSAQTIRNH